MKESVKAGVYQRHLDNFGGLDTTGGGERGANRFARMDNLWRNPSMGAAELLESFPGGRVLYTFPHTVYGMWRWRPQGQDLLVVHAGQSVWVAEFSQTDSHAFSSPPVLVEGEAHLREAPSVALSTREGLYLLDGSGYWCLTQRDGGWNLSSACHGYTPVTYWDGAPYEARNLLSERAISRYTVGVITSFAYSTPGVRYRVTDTLSKTCEVAGMEGQVPDGVLYIGGKAQIGQEEYQVTGIGWKAFLGHKEITEVYIGEGVQTVGVSAFYSCAALRTLSLPDSLECVKRSAFHHCPLERVILGRGIQTVERSNFTTETPLTVYYHGAEEEMAEGLTVEEESNGAWQDATVVYESDYPLRVGFFPILDPATHLYEVRLEGTPLAGEGIALTPVYEGELLTGVLLRCTDGGRLEDGVLEMEYRLDPRRLTREEGMTDFLSANPTFGGEIPEAVTGCTLAAVYDGRFFFGGNPALPGTVFYTSRDREGQINPAYVGVYNYFECGTSDMPIRALLPTSSYLAVLREEPYGDGSVTYYTGQDTGEDLLPRVYMKNCSVQGRGCVGVALSLVDDPVYLSARGLEALTLQGITEERSIVHRSSLVDGALGRENGLPLAAEWQGYLVLLYPSGEAYLADSRRTCRVQGNTEYEWYHLTGVGAYTGDLPVYRYATAYPDDGEVTVLWQGVETPVELHPAGDGLPTGCDKEDYDRVYPTLMEGQDACGRSVFFSVEDTREGERLYLLSATHERTGGTFSAPTALLSAGEKLFWGCRGGQLCVACTDGEDPHKYTYGGHAMVCGFETLGDTCGVPNYTKRTLRQTTVVELKEDTCAFTFQVGIDPGSYPVDTAPLSFGAKDLDFSTLDFSCFAFGGGGEALVALQERTKRWVSKSYRMYTTGFAASFGIRRISYSYQVVGKVKNR